MVQSKVLVKETSTVLSNIKDSKMCEAWFLEELTSPAGELRVAQVKSQSELSTWKWAADFCASEDSVGGAQAGRGCPEAVREGREDFLKGYWRWGEMSQGQKEAWGLDF